MSAKRKSSKKARVNQLSENRFTPQDIRLANREVGHNGVRRLSWALRLAQRDLNDVHVADRLRLQLELSAFALPRWCWTETQRELPGMDIAWETVEKTREAMREILEGRTSMWEREPRLSTVALAFGHYPGGIRFVMGGDQLTNVLIRFGELLNEFSDQIRRCKDPQCGKWFIGPVGKEYCDRRCLMRHHQEMRRHEKGKS